jgi:hypothetical protein
MMLLNHASLNKKTSAIQVVESGISVKALRISVQTVNAIQFPVATEVELIPIAIVTVKPHAYKHVKKDQRKKLLITPIETLRTESHLKLRKPSPIFSLKSSTDASPAASRNALTGKNDHVHLNKTLATSELLTFHNTFNPTYSPFILSLIYL